MDGVIVERPQYASVTLYANGSDAISLRAVFPSHFGSTAVVEFGDESAGVVDAYTFSVQRLRAWCDEVSRLCLEQEAR